jgi:hypothetical protein
MMTDKPQRQGYLPIGAWRNKDDAQDAAVEMSRGEQNWVVVPNGRQHGFFSIRRES